MQNLICKSYDDFLQDKDEAVWIAELNDGTKIYCDDGRYGETDKAWNRLRKYLEEHQEVEISKIRIKFRSHIELAAERTPNTIGFYFGRAASCWVGMPTTNSMIVGAVEKTSDGMIAKTSKWRVPEVIKEESEERNPSDYLENIIWD